MSNNLNATSGVGSDTDSSTADLAEWQALLRGSLIGVSAPAATAVGNVDATGADTAAPNSSSAAPSPLAAGGSAPTPAANAINLALPLAVAAPPTSATSDADIAGTSSPVETIAIQAAAGALTINLELDGNAQHAPSYYMAGFQTAADLLSAAIHNPITINIEVGYTEVPGSNEPLSPGDAAADPAYTVTDTYQQVRSNLLSHATSEEVTSAVSYLPNTTSLNGVTNFSVASAEAKVWGQVSATNSAIDDDAGFGTNIPSNSIVGVALHEFTHGLGRVPGDSVLSLFRYTSPGIHDFVGNVTPTPASYFSINGGVSDLADFGQTSDPSDFLNSGVQGPNDPFNEFYTPGSTLQTLTPLDLTTMDMLGFNVSGSTSTLFEAPAQVSSSFGSSISAGGWTSQDLYPRLLGDVTGNGMADIVGFGSVGTYVSLATGGGNFGSPFQGIAGFGSDPISGGGWTSEDLYPRQLADVNGDHQDDIVGFGSAGTYVSLATGGGNFGAPFLGIAGFGSDPATGGGWTSQNLYPRELGDVTGNGMADIVAFGAQGVYVSLATGGGHFAAPELVLPAFGAAGGWTSQDLYPRFLADVTGNGMDDIVAFGAAGVYVSLATGGGNFAAPQLVLPDFGAAGGWTSQDLYPRLVADVNHDGKADIVGFGASGLDVALATGGGNFATPVADLQNFGASAGGWAGQNVDPRALADVTGDGRADIVGFSAAGVVVSPATTLFG